MNKRKIIGQYGEDIASKYLIRNNYEIIERNRKISYQEIDIIAKIKQEIVFVEVKTRTLGQSGGAEESINTNKVKNIKKAIGAYVYENSIDIDKARFDVIVVNINKINKVANIKHYIAIF